MKTVTVQTRNVDAKIRDKAEKMARKAGLSSLQDLLRIVIINVANEKFPPKVGLMFPDKELEESIRQYKEGKYNKIKSNEKFSEAVERLDRKSK